MIDLKDISRIYQVGSERVYALNKANLHISILSFRSNDLFMSDRGRHFYR